MTLRLTLLIGLICKCAFAEKMPVVSQAFTFAGRVVNCKTEKSIAHCQIYNESQRSGYITDSNGYFRLPVNMGDTLVFSALGYLGKVYRIDSASFLNSQIIPLCERIYEIGEVTVYTPRSYMEFKRQFLDIEPQRDMIIEGVPHPLPREVPLLLDTVYLQSTGFAVFHPISYFYYKYSKEEQSKRQVFLLKQQEKEQFSIDKKYNRELVQGITKLEGEELTEFIGYCNFSHKYLYTASDLQIVTQLERLFEEFQQMKNLPAK